MILETRSRGAQFKSNSQTRLGRRTARHRLVRLILDRGRVIWTKSPGEINSSTAYKWLGQTRRGSGYAWRLQIAMNLHRDQAGRRIMGQEVEGRPPGVGAARHEKGRAPSHADQFADRQGVDPEKPPGLGVIETKPGSITGLGGTAQQIGAQTPELRVAK